MSDPGEPSPTTSVVIMGMSGAAIAADRPTPEIVADILGLLAEPLA